MTAEISVRAGAPADAEAFATLFEAVAAEGRWIGRESPTDQDLMAQRFRDGLTSDSHGSVVAFDGGGLVGAIGLDAQPYGVADLGMLVAASHRRRGIGRRLLDAGIDWARQRDDVHKLALQHWPHNAAAHALYLSVGFVQEGYLHRHYRRRDGDLWDAVVMGLLL